MSSGMNLEQAKEYAKTMTYSEAVSNVRYGKGIKYRKATMIKLRELAEIADRLDRKTEPTVSKMEQVYEPQTYITEDRDTQILDAWQVHHRNTTSVETEPQTDCGWK